MGPSTTRVHFPPDVRQLARLESLAVYFDTDCQSLAGLPYKEFVEKFTELVRYSRPVRVYESPG